MGTVPNYIFNVYRMYFKLSEIVQIKLATRHCTLILILFLYECYVKVQYNFTVTSEINFCSW